MSCFRYKPTSVLFLLLNFSLTSFWPVVGATVLVVKGDDSVEGWFCHL